MRQLTSLDTQFLAMETNRIQGHVSVLGVYDPETASGRPLNAALVRELITERLHLLPTFRWRLAPVPFDLDYPYWVDDGTFDVEYHVREIAVPAPGTQRQLSELVADLIGRQLDRARPLWEVYVIHGLEDGAVGVMTKMHHAAVDGVSGNEVMSILLDDDPAGRTPESTPEIVAERFPSELEMLGRGAWSACCVSHCGYCAGHPARCGTSTTCRRSAACPASRRSREPVEGSGGCYPQAVSNPHRKAATWWHHRPDSRPGYRPTAGSHSDRCRSTT